MMICEVSEAIAELIANAGLSPPMCFGRIARVGYPDRFFIGLVPAESMEQQLKATERDWACQRV